MTNSFRFAFALLITLVCLVDTAQAHLCGPPEITVQVGEVQMWQITADPGEFTLYVPFTLPDSSIATLSPQTSFFDFDGVFAITGVAPGETSFEVQWNYIGIFDNCSVTVNVAGPAPNQIIGLVSDATGVPLQGVNVHLFEGSGNILGTTTSSASGNFSFGGLLPGIFFSGTSNNQGRVNELYDDIKPFFLNTTDPTMGTPIPVTSGATPIEVNYSLDPGGAISGKVIDEANASPLPDINVLLFNQSGNHLTTETTSESGDFHFHGLPLETYFLGTSNNQGYQDELYDNFLRQGFTELSDPTGGTPVSLTNDATDLTLLVDLSTLFFPPLPEDGDGDGINDSVENSAPNNGDGNNDGIADSKQRNVTSLRNSRGRFLTFVSEEGTTIKVSEMNNPSPNDMPAGANFNDGFFEFTIDGLTPAQSTSTTIFLSGRRPVNTYFKFGPTPDNPIPHWYEFLFDPISMTGAEILTDRIILHFVDGKRGDHDLTENGEIDDPGGPSFFVPTIIPLLTDTGGFSGVPAADSFVGVAIFNPAGQSNEISLSVVDSGGNEVQLIDLEGPLAAGGQIAFLTRDQVASVTGDGAIIVRGQQAPVQGFFLIGDDELRRLDGVAGEVRSSTRLYFPLLGEGITGDTLLFVFNPGIEDASSVLFRLFDRNGTLLKEVSSTIASNGFVAGTLGELFAGEDEPVGGYVQVDAAVPLLGFQFFSNSEELSALAAQTPRFATQLWAPHFFIDDQGKTTRVHLLNQGDDLGLTLKAFDDSSNLLAMAEVEVAAGTLFAADVGELLNLDMTGLQQGEAITGYLEMELEVLSILRVLGKTPSVAGAVTFIGSEGNFRSTLPMIEKGKAETVFLQVAQSDQQNISMGLAILNGSLNTATVTVRALDSTGSQTASTQFQMAPGTRVSDLLNGPKFFGPEFMQTGGHLKISTSVPVFSLALISDSSSNFLSAMEGQTGSGAGSN